jgi:hypothetical protein
LSSDPREENCIQDMVTIFPDDYSEFFFDIIKLLDK